MNMGWLIKLYNWLSDIMHKYGLFVIMNMCDKSTSMMWCRVLCILIDELTRFVIWDINYCLCNEYIFVYNQSGAVFSYFVDWVIMYGQSGVVLYFYMSYIMCVVVVNEAGSLVQSGDYWLILSLNRGLRALSGRSRFIEIRTRFVWRTKHWVGTACIYKAELWVWFTVGTVTSMSRVIVALYDMIVIGWLWYRWDVNTWRGCAFCYMVDFIDMWIYLECLCII